MILFCVFVYNYMYVTCGLGEVGGVGDGSSG